MPVLKKVSKKVRRSGAFALYMIFISQMLVAQNERPHNLPSWTDTAFIPAPLLDTIKDNKIVIVNIGEKAIIYLPLQPLLDSSKKELSNDFVKKDFQKIINYLDSATTKGDSIFYGEHLARFEYLVSEQMQKGNAKVLYKKYKTYSDTIYHRLERYGSTASRFFYLPDYRPFFAVLEFTGILDKRVNGNRVERNNFEQYLIEGNKLASLRKE